MCARDYSFVNQLYGAVLVDQHRHTCCEHVRVQSSAVEDRQIAPCIRHQWKVEAELLGESDLSPVALGGINGNSDDFSVGCDKGGSLITERSKMIRSPTGEALGKECQQQVFLAA